MDYKKELEKVKTAQRQAEANANFLAGQAALIEVLIKEQPKVEVEIIKEKKEKK